MNGTVSVKKKDEKPSIMLNELFKKHLMFHDMGKSTCIVSKEKEAEIIGDACKLYYEIGELGLKHEARVILAMQLSLDKHKCPLNLLRKYEGLRLRMEQIQGARTITGVKRVQKPTEYVDSLVTFLKNIGKLDEDEKKKVAKTAKEILAKYEEKETSIPNVMSVSVAVVSRACCENGVPMSPAVMGNILGMGEKTISDASNKVEEITMGYNPSKFEAKRRT